MFPRFSWSIFAERQDSPRRRAANLLSYPQGRKTATMEAEQPPQIAVYNPKVWSRPHFMGVSREDNGVSARQSTGYRGTRHMLREANKKMPYFVVLA